MNPSQLVDVAFKVSNNKEQSQKQDVKLNTAFLVAALKVNNVKEAPRRLSGKEPATIIGDAGSVPWSGRSTGEGNGNPLQHSCLENPMGTGAWRDTVHGLQVTKSWTQLSDQDIDAM